MDPRRLRARFWLPAVEAAGCPTLRPHQIRHLHASMLIDSGIPLTEIASRLGHENTQVTASVYAHLLRIDDSASAGAIPDILREGVVRLVQRPLSARGGNPTEGDGGIDAKNST